MKLVAVSQIKVAPSVDVANMDCRLFIIGLANLSAQYVDKGIHREVGNMPELKNFPRICKMHTHTFQERYKAYYF